MVAGIKYGDGLSDVEKAKLDARVQEAQTKANELARQLEKAVKAEDQATTGVIQNAMLFGPDPKLAAAVAAAKKMKPERRPTLSTCFAVAEAMNVATPLKEEVRVFGKAPNGKFRVICEFGIQHRTAQELCRRAVSPFWVPRRFQCVAPDGVHAAVDRTVADLKDGYAYAAVLDIKRCYQSFDVEKLIEFLPLPEEVVRSVAIGDAMVMRADKWRLPPWISPSYAIQQARQGIPTGSSFSALIQQMVVSKLAWHGMSRLSSYVDDFRLLAKTPDVLQQDAETLREAVAELPGGHFELAIKSEGATADGFRFVGHVFSNPDGEVLVRLPEDSWQKLLARMEKLDQAFSDAIHQKMPKKDLAAMIAHQLAVVRGFEQAFSRCEDIGRKMHLFHSGIQDNAALIGVSMAYIDQLASADIRCFHIYAEELM